MLCVNILVEYGGPWTQTLKYLLTCSMWRWHYVRDFSDGRYRAFLKDKQNNIPNVYALGYIMPL